MKREGHEETTFFVGPEVEHTPAHAKKTLFVVGWQDPTQIEHMARLHKTPHIFLGANHSFDATHTTDYFSETWDKLITHLLDRGFWVTLDYPAHQHEKVLKMLNPGIWQSRIFVPMLSVRIPKVETSSPNLTIKIDDIDFAATNRGVWCMNFHEVTDSNRFTDWQDYATDVTVTPQVGVVPSPVHRVAILDAGNVSVAQLAKIVDNFQNITSTNAKAPVPGNVVSEDKNDGSLGLDTTSASQLKADPDAPNEESLQTNSVASASDAAELYAETPTSTTEGTAAKKSTKVKK